MKVILILLLAFNSLFAVSTDEMTSLSKAELLEKSFRSPSPEIRLSIMNYLAEHYAKSEEGLFSRAYLAEHSGNADLSKTLYSQCNSLYCRFKDIATDVDTDNISTKMKELEGILEHHAAFEDYGFVKIGYFDLLDTIQDENQRRALKKEFLDRWEAKLGKELYIFDLIRGIDEEYIYSHHKKAEAYYVSALYKQGGTKDFEVLERYADLLNKKLFNALEMTERYRTDNLLFMEEYLYQEVFLNKDPSVEFLENLPEDKRIYAYRVYNYFTRYCDETGDEESALDFNLEAYAYYKTVEIVNEILERVSRLHDEAKASRILEFIAKDIKDDDS